MQLGIMDTFHNVDGMQTVLEKSKRLAAFTHRTTTELEKLKEQAVVDNIKFRKLKNPQDTRWNSQHENMASVLDLTIKCWRLKRLQP